ncbi:putative RNA methyltransferase [Brevibacillus sp. B_LB10_24]|uniref:putative RNA methyltransferase n=1 Tax=Brevibacillus sp. B_LB10_24 TaxID=3380645 RepID=UPI0038BC2E30
MSKNSKKMLSAGLIAAHEGMFHCPICHSPMKLEDGKSLQCSRRHSFDLSRRGYVNFLSRPAKGKYDKPLFESRMQICNSGFFEPLHERISERIAQEGSFNSELIIIADAGCGEGSHLARIREKLIHKMSAPLLGVGTDISKEGIDLAAREHPQVIWCVADIARPPFAVGQFSLLLNMLSPSNYAEFQRILADDGMLIKVIPGSGYLQELRSLLYGQTNRRGDDEADTEARFREHFALVDRESVRYSITLDPSSIRHLVRMTPLSWGADEERLQKVKEMNELEVTIHLIVLYGKKLS